MKKDKRVIKLCQHCKKEMLIIPSLLASKKYCSRSCQREWRREQAEYWKINTEELKTLLEDTCIEDYDSYILADELICPFKGCNWRGQSFSAHCFSTHGVGVHTIKEVLGFNKTTGMVTREVSKKLGKAALAVLERDGRNTPEYMEKLRELPTFKENNNHFERRDELRGHQKIAQKLKRRKNYESIVCKHCGIEFTPMYKIYGKQRQFCSQKCLQNHWYRIRSK